MDDNCGELVECMGVASGCGEQEAGVASRSGWNLWVWLLGVVVRRYVYRFPHTTYPYSSFFLQQHPYFLFILLCFSFLYIYSCVILRRKVITCVSFEF